VGQHRSSQRHVGKVGDLEEAKLRHRLREIAAQHIRWSRRLAHRLLRREGWTVNHKRVHRLWRDEGLQRPTPASRRGHARLTARCDVTRLSTRTRSGRSPWASAMKFEFQFHATTDGRRLKFLNVINEYSCLCLAIRVGRRCKSNDVVAVLEQLTSLYPAPAFIRSDNGPEFIAHALKRWSENSGTTTTYIEPGSPSGLIQSLSQCLLPGLSAWVEVGEIAPFPCLKAPLRQPIST